MAKNRQKWAILGLFWEFFGDFSVSWPIGQFFLYFYKKKKKNKNIYKNIEKWPKVANLTILAKIDHFHGYSNKMRFS